MLWGTSLCWWANIEYPDDVKDKLMELLFGESGLQLNVIRYNLGGGSDPNIKQSMRAGGLMPCISNDKMEFNLENDKNQIDILDRAVKMGVNNVEIFCNSPPYWMTRSGLTNGSKKGFESNLRWSSIDDFSNFLIKSYDILKSKYPVVSIEPFNEPSNPYWLSTGNQEGCYYDYFTRCKLIRTIKKKRPDLLLAATDEFSTGFALFWWIFSPKKLINRINMHTYRLGSFGWEHYKNYSLPDDYDIVRKCFRWLIGDSPLWMSEFGLGGSDDLKTGLRLARHIFRDLKSLNPEAWIYWQVVENLSDNGWGLIQINFDNPREMVIQWQYYIFMHFTRSIKETDKYNVSDYEIEIKNQNKTAHILLNDTDKPIKIKKIMYSTCYITDANNKYNKSSGQNYIDEIPAYTIMSLF